MAKERQRHKNISTEQIASLEAKGFIHAGYDAEREREVFHRALSPGTTSNPKKIACEFVNTSKWELRIAEVEGQKVIPFPSGAIVYMPHGYEGWQVQHRDGSPYQGELLVNYGDAMHKGNNKPSRPEPKVKAFRSSRHN